MATSGTTAFNMDFTEIAEEAWERAGREMRSGYDLRTARRSMNLLTIEWQNRGINMWTIEEGTLNLAQGTATYNLPADTIDLLEHVVRTGDGNITTQSDLNITRISVSTYSSIPNKLSQGRPIQMYIDRGQVNPTATVWPVPDQGTLVAPYYILKYWRMRRIEDAGTGVNTADVNFRFLPCLVAGLAYYIAQKDPDLMPRIPMLQAEYERQFELAAGEDREKAIWREVDMSYKYASGQKAIAICDVCGFQYKLRELKELVIKGNKTNIKACPECWNPDQPQNKLGEFPVEDPQALRNPRPDSAELVASRDIQWGWDPVGLNDPFGLTPDNLEGRGAVGSVTVTTS
jgi:hypothetical protein